MRSIGALATDEQFHPGVPRDDFHAIVYLEETTPAVQLPIPPR
jgi:hypothetical protein